MIDIIGPFVWWRGVSKTFRITVTDDADARYDLTVADLEFQIKATPGGADPPLVSKSVGSGITKLPQSDDTIGQADITCDVADTSDAAKMPDGIYYLDVVSIVGAFRSQVVAPLEFRLKSAVNLP